MSDLLVPALIVVIMVALALIMRARRSRLGQPVGLDALSPRVRSVFGWSMLMVSFLDIVTYLFISSDITRLALGIAGLGLGAYLLLSTRQAT
jgi:hypothetical protein